MALQLRARELASDNAVAAHMLGHQRTLTCPHSCQGAGKLRMVAYAAGS